MKKKLLLLILSIVCVLGCITGLVGCDFGNISTDNPPDGEKHKHELELVPANNATCTEDGNSEYYVCSGCGKWFADRSGTIELSNKDKVIIVHSGHDLTLVPANGATETEDGNNAYYVCDNCEKWYEDEDGAKEITDKTSVIIPATPADVHDLTPVTANSATCTLDGNKAYYTCNDCEKWFEDAEGKTEITDKSSVVIAHSGHNLTPVTANDATCTDDGNSAYYTCSKCEKWYEDEEGKTEITDKTSVVIPVDGHDLAPVPANDATCTDDGNSAYYICEVCEKWYEDEEGKTEITDKTSVVIPADGHDLTPIPANSATCTEDGNKAYYTCNDCEKWYEDEEGKTEITDKTSVVIPADGHDLTPVTANSATCTEDGNSAYYICEVCEKWYEDAEGKTEIADKTSVVIPADGHDLTPVTANDATCTEDGNSAYYKCEVCGKWYEDEECTKEITDKTSVVIPKGHSLTPVTANDATCTLDGNKAYYICEVCEKWYEDEECTKEITDKTSVVIPADGHDLTPVTANSATCTDDGNKAYYICEVCGKWYEDEEGETEITDKTSVVIPADGHTLTPVTANDATCTLDGNKAYYICEVCEKWYEDEECTKEITNRKSVVIPAAHKYAEGECSVCGALQPTEGLAYTLNADRKSYTVSGKGSAKGNDIVIASEYNDLPVTAISEKAFYRGNITSVVIPDSINSIGESAFEDCSKLVSITLGKGITSMGTYSFLGASYKTLYFTGDIADWCKITRAFTLLDSYHTIYIDGVEIKGELRIPEGVTEIGAYAFRYCTTLTKVILPESLTKISDGAFQWCTGLTEINIPDNVIEIGEIAFWNCIGLESIEFGANVKKIGDKAFRYSGLKSVTVGGKVTEIGESAFSDCSNLESITIQEGVKSIGASAFANCRGLTSINIPSTVTSIGMSVLYSCSNLESITIPFVGPQNGGTEKTYLCYIFGSSSYSGNSEYVPASLKKVTVTAADSIPDYAFYGCENITEIELSDSVKSIGRSAFYNCVLLSDISFNKVKSIGDSAFGGCVSLLSITLPDSLTSIGSSAFDSCSGLTSVTVPDKVTSIGLGAFSNCDNMASITIPFVGATKNGTTDNLFGYIFFNLTSGYVSGSNNIPNGVVVPSSLKSVTVTGGRIADYAFYKCLHLTEVSIGNKISIGEYAFCDCSSIESITLGEEITVASYAFEKCSELTNITLSPGCKAVAGTTYPAPSKVFLNCSKISNITYNGSLLNWINDSMVYYLTEYGSNQRKLIVDGQEISGELIIPNEASYITSRAFYGITDITSVKIPAGVNNIGQYAFYNCTGLQSVENSGGLTVISKYTFSNCRSLTSIEIPATVTEIETYAFSDCRSLTSIEIPEGVKKIDSYAFSYSGLINITLPDSLEEIEGYTFANSASLSSITIPDNVTKIGIYVFRSCTGLKEVSIGNGVGEIKTGLFSGCTGLEEVTISNVNITIPKNAFGDCTNLTSLTIPFVGAKNTGAPDDAYFGYIFGAKDYTANGSSAPASLKNVTVTGCDSLPDNAFYGCSKLTSVTIGDSITSIGKSAFSGCSALTDVILGNGLKSIGDELFEGCTMLTNVTIGNSVKSIGKDAFYNCRGLTTITIPEAVESIGNYAFYGCSNLSSVDFENGVQSLGLGVFNNCTALTSITIPDSVTSVGTDTFKNCPIETATIPICALSAISSTNNKTLKKVIITSGTIIGATAFSGYTALESVTILSEVTSIGNEAFFGCRNLKSLTIPNSVTSIGEMAFWSCTELTVYYNGTAEEWTTLISNSESNALQLSNSSGVKTYLSDSAIYYYSQTAPTTDGNYWHYDEDEVTPVIWPN